MIYLSGGVPRGLPPHIGLMLTPQKGNRLPPGRTWAADNGCFTRPDLYSDDGYLRWLDRQTDHRESCMFATAPDVVGDAIATLDRSLPMLRRIRSAGFPPALVAQDGLHPDMVPWPEIDFLFIGGSTAWKIGPDAAKLAIAAARNRCPVHMGRVNSLRRMLIAKRMGCRSVDGTFLAFGPDKNLPRLNRWIDAVGFDAQLTLPFGASS